MPDVVFSSFLQDTITTNLFGVGKAYSSSFNSISFYSTEPDVSTITTRTSYESLSTGRLIKNDTVNAVKSGNSVTFTTDPGNATATGVAGWFIIGSSTSSGGDDFHAIKGTVTGLGGGGDLEIADTSVVSGESYRLSSLTINHLEDFSY